VTLTTRLLIFFLSMLAVVLVTFSAAIYWLASEDLHHQENDKLTSTLNTISGAIESGRKGVEWEPYSHRHSFNPLSVTDTLVWVVSDDQGIVVDRSTGEAGSHLWSELSESPPFPHVEGDEQRGKIGDWLVGRRVIRKRERLDEELMEEAERDEHDGTVIYPELTVSAGVSLLPVRATLQRLGTALFGLSLLVWMVMLVAGRWVCRKALSPLQQMADAATEIQADNLAQRLPPVETRDELFTLNLRFNELLDRVHRAFEQQRRFTGDASHQLRTPLTVILGQIEVALRRDRADAEYERVLETVQRRVEQLVQMVESLLFLSRADAETRLPTLESIDLCEWLPERLLEWSEHPRAADIICKIEPQAPCVIKAQPALLGELLNILLDNACKFSEPETSITMRLNSRGNTVDLSVEDQGCGIEPGDLPHLFEPFCRSESARIRGVDGVGLGLSIAKRLADVFGGTVSSSSRPGQGSTFTVQLPLVAIGKRLTDATYTNESLET